MAIFFSCVCFFAFVFSGYIWGNLILNWLVVDEEEGRREGIGLETRLRAEEGRDGGMEARQWAGHRTGRVIVWVQRGMDIVCTIGEAYKWLRGSFN